MVATTRPETILGDTAVAVHPEDPRYQKFVGRKVVVPVLGRLIPVIADSYVSREFGSGALKITPGHDPNDYEIGQRHNLPIISMLDEAARINVHGGPYQGQDRFECRKNLWEDMRQAGLVVKEEPYTLNVPRTQRGGEIVEPMVSTQWFVHIQPLADKALEAVRDGRIHIVPERFTKVYYNWLENIQDWCISRQLWWGHRIPVWYCAECGQSTVTREDPGQCAHCGSTHIEQDPRCAGYLVFFRALAIFYPGLARSDTRPGIFLPDDHDGNGLRHPVLLGGSDDHDGVGIYWGSTFQYRVFARVDPR